MCKKESCVASAAMVMAIAAMMFFPVIGIAGILEPSAPPAPTMKTLDQIPPTWSQKLLADKRFELVLDGAAVLDKETGLVWEQSPGNWTYFSWYDASYHCTTLNLGGRKGWHLPTIEQLASLVDPSVPEPGPTLPLGHPFTNVQPSYYWSATTSAVSATYAWSVYFGSGGMFSVVKTGDGYCAWCVRGGETYDAY